MEKYNWKNRPLSWSAISSFEWSPEQWYQRYVVHGACKRATETEPAFCFITSCNDPDCPAIKTSVEMLFGSMIGKKLETDPTFLPQIPRHSKMEYKFSCKLNNLILIGFADTFCDKTFKKLGEFKTGRTEWTQKKVDGKDEKNYGQLDMYLLMNYLINKVRPEDVDVFLVWMPTKENGDFSISFIEPIEKNIKVFKTKRTMMDILQFGKRIHKTYKDMEEYVKLKELAL